MCLVAVKILACNIWFSHFGGECRAQSDAAWLLVSGYMEGPATAIKRRVSVLVNLWVKQAHRVRSEQKDLLSPQHSTGLSDSVARSSSLLPSREQAYLLMFTLQWLPDKVLLVEAARREVPSFFPWAFFISL